MRPTGNGPQHRFELQRHLLSSGRFFKVICGAGNEDAEEVYKLSLVYTLAGAAAIDLSATVEVVRAAARAVCDAERLAPEFGIAERAYPFLTVSVGMPGDPHVRKARILTKDCTACNACIPVCPADAIPASLEIIQTRCIGCGACSIACQDDAIEYVHKQIEIESALRECVAAGAENLELHAALGEHEQTLAEWHTVVNAVPQGFVSVCVDRGYLSNVELQRRLTGMLRLAPGRMIVQADGIPMSGGKDDFNTTLQAVATADIVAKMRLPVHILVSGGTNSKSAELARTCGIPCAGISIGTYARHLVYEFINDSSFPRRDLLGEAVRRAARLVDVSNRPLAADSANVVFA